MKITYDRFADAAYIYLVDIPPAGVAETYPLDPNEKLVTGLALDFDKSGKLLGIEVLGAKRRLPEHVLQEAELLS